MKKIMALYLPQYHSIPENDAWWGKGYTEWTAVKSAKPLFRGHVQPKKPQGNNYYDLSDETGETWKWQATLARKYGIYGFAIYHYWFGNGKMLLEKPMEILLNHKEIDINYSIVWANETWTRTWYGLESQELIKQEYCDERDWEAHFNYLLKFFQDERYIKVDGKPVVHIYKSRYIDDLEAMVGLWNRLAKENGFEGVYIVVGNTINGVETRTDCIDAYYNFEPGYSMNYKSNMMDSWRRKAIIFARTLYNSMFKKEILERKTSIDPVYRAIEKQELLPKKNYLGTFPTWDNTPRRGYKGILYTNASVEKFYKSLRGIYQRAEDEDFIYINAWNEWGEGCYLEPDTENGFLYLETIKRVIENTEEKK